ncbi:hypothetical protein NDI85_09560 [Halomicroarcula sp. S1AR25-4]|uniref:hypothetical protein n=1 Tax=Haloarcula sp. S1AR25-4 TaxID=2950538 RepID=UPI002876B381|nr:hypothetical protein [Halomicroarcula sp. S1AR25-4]MDS0278041.1 hypothetical protein [Halomicroarcula sp. S1AR25-4]
MTPPNRLALARPLEPPDVPAVEMVSTTRRAEARSVMALVAALRSGGVPVRDIALVVRDLDAYEEPLFRAAMQYGVTPVFWTQLRVTRTRPYALVESVCDALAGERVDTRTLLRPLEHRWAPASAAGHSWPVEPGVVQRAIAGLPDGARPVEEWVEVVATTDDVDARIGAFVQWLSDVPEPRPETVASVLGAVVEAYADYGLPETKAADAPALLATETDARAVVRVRTLVQQLRHKFAERVDDGSLERSWADVAELSSVIATQRPGRREHSNARAVDVLEANDVWALDVPYVVAVGLTATEWPQETESTLPPEFQEAVLRGAGSASTLAPSPAWTDGRDRDHFADTLCAAASGVVLTRHTETGGGDTVHPSPFLTALDTDSVSAGEMERLRSADRALPAPIRAMLSEAGGETDD